MHGCPYKVFGKGQLTAALGRLGLKASAAQTVVNKAQEGHFQLACAAAFEGVHSCACDTGINHPNQVCGLLVPVMPSSSQGKLGLHTAHALCLV